MSPILAVMLVVACDPDLIHCRPVTHWPAIWSNVEACDRDREDIEEIARRRHGPAMEIMTQCRLFLDDDGKLRASLPLQERLTTAGALRQR